jgi:hypothetical protein
MEDHMRRFCTNMVAIALATLLLVAVSSAQQTSTTTVPNLIRYSGTLKDAQGAVPPGTPLGVTFAIYKQQDGGVPVWQEIQNVTPDASGQYSVVLGSTTATGLPDDLFLQQEQRWLGVQLQGEDEQARVLLVSVPYAFKAHEAETLGGLPQSAFVKVPPPNANGIASNSGSGTSGNNATAVIAPQSSGSTVAQDGAWTRAGTSVKLSTGTDKVGIGTSTPKAKLDVAGNVHASGSISSGDATVTLNGNENAITVDSVPPTPPGQASQLYMGGENAAGTIPFSKIQVGIGTKNLGTTKVQIFDPVFPTLGISTPIGGVELTVATSAGFFSNFAIPGDAVLRVPGSPGQNLILTARGTGGIRFGTGRACGGGFPCETEKMTLLENGNFGIGSNNPPTALAVGNFLSLIDRTDPPFQVSNIGDMVKIKKVAYSWPTAQGAANTVLTNNGAGILSWAVGGGNVIGPGNCGANFLTKWTGGFNVGCTHDYEAPSNFFLGVNVGTAPAAALDVNGQGTSGINTTDTRQSYMIGLHPVLQVFGLNNLSVGVGACPLGTGGSNTCVGAGAGNADNGGFSNTFVGGFAGSTTVAGHDNTCVGEEACQFNIAGLANVSVGAAAGAFNNNSYNVFVGQAAGHENTGTGNIFIGYSVGAASSPESKTIRIGAPGFETNAYIAGIWNVGPINPAANVCIDSTGHLGTICVISSRRFKEQIADMGDSSSKLFELRPVTFFYKPEFDDGSHLLQYGLIAEEVAKVYPDMAVYGKDGQPLTVKYQLLAPMLLNELQKQHAVVTTQQDVIRTQQEQIQSLQERNDEFQQRLSRLESLIAKK